jgi:hypothetical protein
MSTTESTEISAPPEMLPVCHTIIESPPMKNTSSGISASISAKIAANSA